MKKQKMTIAEKTELQAALAITYTLSKPSKMPCFSYNIPAKYCKTGSKLRSVKNSVCSFCYALKGRYNFSNVQTAMELRFQAMKNSAWVESMALVINKIEKSGFFRWHDSGDIQSVKHFADIVKICLATPHIKHWLPTREFMFVAEFIRGGGIIPENLTVRLSGLMLNGPAPMAIARHFGLVVSSASDSANFTCPASKQAGICGDCRACWSKEVFEVSYKKH